MSVGLAGTSGPILPEDGQQRLVWSETAVVGPQACDAVLPAPDKGIPATARPAGQMVFNPSTNKGAAAYTPHSVAVLAVPDKEAFGPAEVIDLSTKIDAGGHLRWDAPAAGGKFCVLPTCPPG